MKKNEARKRIRVSVNSGGVIDVKDLLDFLNSEIDIAHEDLESCAPVDLSLMQGTVLVYRNLIRLISKK